MRVVQLIYSLSSGGAERFVVDLSNELSRQGHEVHLVIFRKREGSEWFRPLLDNNVVYHNMEIKVGFSLYRTIRVIKVIRKKVPDIVHCHLNVIPYVFLLALLWRDRKFFHTLHSSASYTVGSGFQARINRFFYKRSIIKPITVSRISNESYKEFYNLPDTHVIENGRSQVKATGSYESAKSEVQSYLGNTKKPVFVHVARAHPAKNQDLLVSSFNYLHEKGVNFVLLVIGKGHNEPGDTQSLQDKACDSIKFLGEKENVGDYLLLADAFCLTSKYEGLPISLLEALSAGCVPVCTAVGGIPDVITDGITGYLAKDGSIETYCAALMRYIDNPGAISKQTLIAHFTDNFSIEKCASSYERLYG